jgi:putative transposase
MPTCGRIIHDGAVCHIMQRGNNKQKIFRDDEDYGELLSLFDEYRNEFAFELYNYCLMPNHLHLLLKIFKKEDLPKLMQGIFQSYRFYFKDKYQYTGYLYQGRYKSKLVESDSYLLDCARYIERNPLRAGIADNILQYKWSSYPFYALGQMNVRVKINPLFCTLAKDAARRREAYVEYVCRPRPYEDILDKVFGMAGS